jgi:hypothetical protein
LQLYQTLLDFFGKDFFDLFVSAMKPQNYLPIYKRRGHKNATHLWGRMCSILEIVATEIEPSTCINFAEAYRLVYEVTHTHGMGFKVYKLLKRLLTTIESEVPDESKARNHQRLRSVCMFHSRCFMLRNLDLDALFPDTVDARSQLVSIKGGKRHVFLS